MKGRDPSGPEEVSSVQHGVVSGAGVEVQILTQKFPEVAEKAPKVLSESWNCEHSPTSRCWYDEKRDPAWDGCLFCGDPHERK